MLLIVNFCESSCWKLLEVYCERVFWIIEVYIFLVVRVVIDFVLVILDKGDELYRVCFGICKRIVFF